ncbi:hypothetical protein [Streptomyces pseudogriseolus]|uniref:hypothetical protein n=1 Tax=Streptomyces pseudogriseolus TaxID=36817 RepID=UPI0034940719
MRGRDQPVLARSARGGADRAVAPDPDEIAWYDWLTEPQLAELVDDEAFVPDARQAYHRWAALRRGGPAPAGPAD